MSARSHDVTHATKARPRDVSPQPTPSPTTSTRGPLDAERVLLLQRTAGNAAVVSLLDAEPQAQPTTPDATGALQRLIAQVEQLQANVDPGDADEYLSTVAATLDQMRAAAAGDDEGLKAAILSAFTTNSLQGAASQLTLASDTPYDPAAADDVAEAADATAQALAVTEPIAQRENETVEVQRDVATALVAAGSLMLAADADAAPVEAATGPPGWAVAGTVAIIAVGLIGIGYLMASAQPETLSEDEKEAIRKKEQGLPYDQETYNRARRKQIKNEKFEGERNKRKQRGGG